MAISQVEMRNAAQQYVAERPDDSDSEIEQEARQAWGVYVGSNRGKVCMTRLEFQEWLSEVGVALERRRR